MAGWRRRKLNLNAELKARQWPGYLEDSWLWCESFRSWLYKAGGSNSPVCAMKKLWPQKSSSPPIHFGLEKHRLSDTCFDPKRLKYANLECSISVCIEVYMLSDWWKADTMTLIKQWLWLWRRLYILLYWREVGCWYTEKSALKRGLVTHLRAILK